MPAICYEENPLTARASASRGFDPSRVDPNKGYLRHYENYLLLQFMLANGTTEEKMQASRELVKCERTMAWHENHAAFEAQRVYAERARLKARWARSPRVS
jgi:hypothetical protein